MPEPSSAPDRPPVKVGIVEVTSYTGVAIARLIAGHEGFRVVTASSDARAGNALRDLDRDLGEDGDAVIVGHGDAVLAAKDLDVDLIFLATSPERAARMVGPLLDAGIRVVDLSGAHRLERLDDHLGAYGTLREPGVGHRGAAYGLTEHAAPGLLEGAQLVANPGRYPTASLLALGPLVDAGLVDAASLVIDGKCGTTGEGRLTQVGLLMSELHGELVPRRIGCRNHVPEIVQELRKHGRLSEAPTFVTHLLPVARGLLSTHYFRVPPEAAGTDDVDAQARHLRDVLVEAYADAPFVRVIARPEDLRFRDVVGTNRCLLSVVGEPMGGRVVLVAVLDNLLKGSAGQALQNANRMVGYAETAGLGLGVGGVP